MMGPYVGVILTKPQVIFKLALNLVVFMAKDEALRVKLLQRWQMI